MVDYELWLKEAENNPELKKELKAYKKSELEDAFSAHITFGTGGMRGVMGAGTNRLNIYTLRKANYGLGSFLLKKYKGDVSRGVVISHDNRMHSRDFAFESAKVLGAFGIKCYMFDDLRPTPELSFAVRHLHACAGIMITASHNPYQYNGYKTYDEDGCQHTPDLAKEIVDEANKVTNVFDIDTVDIETMKTFGLFKLLDKSVDDAFVEAIKTVQLLSDAEKTIKIAYSPLHGTGAETAKRVLSETGYDSIFVEEQMEHDPLFKTVKLPNPEDPNAFELLEKLGLKENADLLIATDPDADRVGIGVLNNGKYEYLTGNQTGALLIYYRFNKMKELGLLPEKGKVFNTIVTSELGAKIAKSFGFSVFSTLTGFKFIGEQAKLLEGTDTKYLFGYEESYGYLIMDYARDKDSMQSLLLISEMANYYKTQENKNLCEVLNEIYEKFGYFKEYTSNIYFEGADGVSKMQKITAFFRENKIDQIASIPVFVKEDYLTGERYQLQQNLSTPLTLPKSDVIKYILDNDTWVVVRPSGTEPKLKIYYSSKGQSMEDSERIVKALDEDMQNRIKSILEN